MRRNLRLARARDALLARANIARGHAQRRPRRTGVDAEGIPVPSAQVAARIGIESGSVWMPLPEVPVNSTSARVHVGSALGLGDSQSDSRCRKTSFGSVHFGVHAFFDSLRNRGLKLLGVAFCLLQLHQTLFPFREFRITLRGILNDLDSVDPCCSVRPLAASGFRGLNRSAQRRIQQRRLCSDVEQAGAEPSSDRGNP